MELIWYVIAALAPGSERDWQGCRSGNGAFSASEYDTVTVPVVILAVLLLF